jgi:NTE family protein
MERIEMTKNPEQKNNPIKVGLALGSGAARGLTHIGALKAIEEKGIKISYISGTSMGALIGGAYALGFSVKELEKIALQTDWKLMAKLFSPTFPVSSLMNTSYLTEFLNTLYGNKTFEDLRIPFSAIATDIQTGKMVVIDSEDLLTAIRASCSMPLVCSPVAFGKYKLVDGGLVNPTPIDIVKNMKMDKVIAVNLRKFSTYINDNENEKKVIDANSQMKEFSLNEKIQYLIKHPRHYSGSGKNMETSNPKFWRTLYHMYIIVQVQIGDLNMQLAKPDVLIEPDASDFKTFDFIKAKELIEIGYLAAKEKLARIEFV